MLRRRQFLEVGFLGLLSACTASSLGTENTTAIPLTISAASSVQEVLQEVGLLYQQQHSNVRLTYNFGSSGSLRHQIEQGAPVDIFLSAAVHHMDALATKELLLETTRHNLLKNKIVLITANENLGLKGFSQLNQDDIQKIALGAPDSVPAGKYAKEVLDSLQLYQSLEDKFIFAKDVRQVLTYVETGNVEAGIVYSTDAQISEQVKVIEAAPFNSHSPILYPISVIQKSQYPQIASSFLDFLAGDIAKTIFQKYGFEF